MKTFLFAAAAALLLAGCETGIKIPDRIPAPIAVACVDPEFLEPPLRLRGDAELLELDDYKVIQALRADRGRAQERLDKLQAIVERCSKVSGPPLPPLGVGVRE